MGPLGGKGALRARGARSSKKEQDADQAGGPGPACVSGTVTQRGVTPLETVLIACRAGCVRPRPTLPRGSRQRAWGVSLPWTTVQPRWPTSWPPWAPLEDLL